MDSQQAALHHNMAKGLLILHNTILEAEAYIASHPQSSELLKETTTVLRATYDELLQNFRKLLSLHGAEVDEAQAYMDLSDLFKGSPFK